MDYDEKEIAMSTPIRLNKPKDFTPYRGADKSYQPSAEVVSGQPVHWFSQCGTGPWGFGVYVFRQVGGNQATYVRYKDGAVADVMDGRGDLDVGGDGVLYVNGSETDADATAEAYPVPGYVPFRNSAGQPVSPPVNYNDPRVPALEARIAALEAALNGLRGTDAALTTRVGRVEGQVASKIDSPTAEAIAWQKAGDRMFGEVTGDTATRHAIEQVVQAAASRIVVATTDDTARAQARAAHQTANEAHETASTALAEVMKKTTPQEVERHVQDGITAWLEASIAYIDTRLLNLLWDRAVKLLRFKESNGKTAAQLPINDPKNISR